MRFRDPRGPKRGETYAFGLPGNLKHIKTHAFGAPGVPALVALGSKTIKKCSRGPRGPTHGKIHVFAPPRESLKPATKAIAFGASGGAEHGKHVEKTCSFCVCGQKPNPRWAKPGPGSRNVNGGLTKASLGLTRPGSENYTVPPPRYFRFARIKVRLLSPNRGGRKSCKKLLAFSNVS